MRDQILEVCIPQSRSQLEVPPFWRPTGITDKFVVLDGLNLMYLRNPKPKLTNLLTIVLHVAQNASDFSCVFDANTRHQLARAGRFDDANAYVDLLDNFDSFFIEVTGGTRADDVILAEADARSAIVVSNDRFRPYVEQYQWLKERNRLLHANPFREHVHFNGHSLPIRSKLQRAIKSLENTIGKFHDAALA